MTWWQKLLKAVGLYKPPKQTKKTAARKQSAERPAPKSGTRVAKTTPPPQKEINAVESKRLYVGNLSYDASEYDLEDLFKGVGSVRNIEIVYNRNTHKSKGYGFVEMGNIDEARRAVEVLHDQPFMGRKMVVNGAKSQAEADQEGDDAPTASRDGEDTPAAESDPVDTPPKPEKDSEEAA